MSVWYLTGILDILRLCFIFGLYSMSITVLFTSIFIHLVEWPNIMQKKKSMNASRTGEMEAQKRNKIH